MLARSLLLSSLPALLCHAARAGQGEPHTAQLWGLRGSWATLCPGLNLSWGPWGLLKPRGGTEWPWWSQSRCCSAVRWHQECPLPGVRIPVQLSWLSVCDQLQASGYGASPSVSKCHQCPHPCFTRRQGLLPRFRSARGVQVEPDLKCCVHWGVSLPAATELAGAGRCHRGQGLLWELLSEPVPAVRPRGWRLRGPARLQHRRQSCPSGPGEATQPRRSGFWYRVLLLGTF